MAAFMGETLIKLAYELSSFEIGKLSILGETTNGI